MTRTTLNKKLTTIQILLGFLIGFAAFSVFHFTAPALVFMTAKNWEVTTTYVSAELEGYKIRNCSPVQGASAGYINKDGVLFEVPLVAQSKTKEGLSKPATVLYKLNFGKWNWEYDTKKYNVVSVMAMIKYECDGTMISQQTGPFVIPPEMLQANAVK